MKKVSKAQVRRDSIEAWHDRDPWPCLILAVDPGRAAGSSLVLSSPSRGVSLLSCESIDTMSRALENAVNEAVSFALKEELHLFLALEDWGAGGMRGIDQWIGLGEARGPWRREFLLACEETKTPFLRKKNIVKINMTRWRSRIVPETGTRTDSGKFVRFTPDEWKAAAKRAAVGFYLNQYIPPYDAAESACIGAFAARSDEIGSKIPKRLLASHGLVFSPLEPTIK